MENASFQILAGFSDVDPIASQTRNGMDYTLLLLGGAGGRAFDFRKKVIIELVRSAEGYLAVIVLFVQNFPEHDANVTFMRNAESLLHFSCLLYTSPSPRDRTRSRMPSSA